MGPYSQKSRMKTFFLDVCGKFGFYPKKTRFRSSTKYAKRIFKGKPIIAAEIGVDQGKNALNIFKNLNVKKIYLIDPYVEYQNYLDSAPHKNRKYMNAAQKEAAKRLREYKNRIIWIKEFSENAVNKIPKCDFIYIDGNHNYDYVKKDIKLYFKKVNNGGILAGHDIEERGVFRAVSEFAVKNKLNAWATYPDWIIQK